MDFSNQNLNLFDFNYYFDKRIKFAYSGFVKQDTIIHFGKSLSLFTKENQSAYKKLFYTFIELVTNVSFYSAERIELEENKDYGIGTFLFGENENSFIFSVGNAVNNADMEVLKKKCELINQMNRDELREFKKSQRNLMPGTKGNAHIGLIMVSLMTKRRLNVEFKKIDENKTFFAIHVEVDKKMIENDTD